MAYRRFYFSGSIALGVFSWLHRFQFSISSSRCTVAHSNTNAIARRGKEPRMTRKSCRSISASGLGVKSVIGKNEPSDGAIASIQRLKQRVISERFGRGVSKPRSQSDPGKDRD